MAKPDPRLSGGPKRRKNKLRKENRKTSSGERETETPDRLSTCSSQILGGCNQSLVAICDVM